MAGLAGIFRPVGMLAVNNLDPAQALLVVPTHFTVPGVPERGRVSRPLSR